MSNTEFITCVEIPVSNYEGNDVFMMRLYFKGKKSPTRQQVLWDLKRMDERSLEDSKNGWGPYIDSYKEAISIVSSIKDWEFVSPNHTVCRSITTEHPKFGRQPFTWLVIEPTEI